MIKLIKENINMVRELNENYGISDMIYQVLDGHYLSSSGSILESTIQDEVWETVKEKFSNEITNKRRTVVAIVWQAFIDLINYQGNEEFGRGYGWKMDQKAVQRWFKRNGVDYKEVLKPVVDSVEELRKERLNKKESLVARNLKEAYVDYSDDYEGYHEFGYKEPDENFYSDVFGNFTVEEYYNDETDDVMGWTWSCSDDFAPTQEYFGSAEDAFMDAVNVLSPDDGSVLVIDGDFDSYGEYDSYGYDEYGYDDYDEDEDNEDEMYESFITTDDGDIIDLENPTDEIIDQFRNDMYNAIANVMFNYRDYDISADELHRLVDRFYRGY